MKKAYARPHVEVVEFRFADHVAAASGTYDCYWGSSWSYTHKPRGCMDKQTLGTEGYLGLNG